VAKRVFSGCAPMAPHGNGNIVRTPKHSAVASGTDSRHNR
jgi:hypothetical protein